MSVPWMSAAAAVSSAVSAAINSTTAPVVAPTSSHAAPSPAPTLTVPARNGRGAQLPPVPLFSAPAASSAAAGPRLNAEPTSSPDEFPTSGYLAPELPMPLTQAAAPPTPQSSTSTPVASAAPAGSTTAAAVTSASTPSPPSLTTHTTQSPTSENTSAPADAAAAITAPSSTLITNSNDESAFQLKAFTSDADTTALRLRTLKAFRDLAQEHHKACVSLEKFKQKCSLRHPEISLPKGIQLRFVDQARFTPVERQPLFYEKEEAALRKLAAETTTVIHATMLSAKERHIKHLLAELATEKFVARQAPVFLAFVHTSFDSMLSPLHGPGALAVPSAADSSPRPLSAVRQQAIDFLVSDLRQEITKHWMQHNKLQAERLEAENKARENEQKAGEQIMAGAHNGNTIAAIARREVVHQLQPIRQQLQKAAAATSSRTPPSTSAQQQPQRVRQTASPGFAFLPSLFRTSHPSPATKPASKRKKIGTSASVTSVDADGDEPMQEQPTESDSSFDRGGEPRNTRRPAKKPKVRQRAAGVNVGHTDRSSGDAMETDQQ